MLEQILRQAAGRAAHYSDLRGFARDLEAGGDLRRIRLEIDPQLEVTEVCYRTLRAGGPALLFERPKGATMPMLGNLFGDGRRVARPFVGPGATQQDPLG